MQKIPLRARDGTVRAYVLVDDRDHPALSFFHWWYDGRYAVREASGRKVYLHRQIMGLTPGDVREVDHRDWNKLNCQRANLRVVTHAQNAQNASPRRDNTSGYRGVTWIESRGKWQAQCGFRGRNYSGGYHENVEEAALAAAALRRRLFTDGTP